MKLPSSLKIPYVVPENSRKTDDLKPPSTIFVNKTKDVDIKRSPEATSSRQYIATTADVLLEQDEKKSILSTSNCSHYNSQ